MRRSGQCLPLTDNIFTANTSGDGKTRNPDSSQWFDGTDDCANFGPIVSSRGGTDKQSIPWPNLRSLQVLISLLTAIEVLSIRMS